jgi:cytochrome P450
MDRLSYLQRKRERHGDVFAVRPVNGAPSVVVSDPELIKVVFTAPADVLQAGECNRQAFGPLVGEASLLLLDGERHLRHRRLILPALHGEILERQASVMRSIAESHLAEWPAGEEMRALPRLRALTVDIVLKAIFGSEGGVARALRDVLPAQLLMANTEQSDASQAAAFVRQAEEAIEREIAARRARAVRPGNEVLSQLIAARDEEGTGLSDEELRDEAMTLIVAGTGTTANSLAWALERLARAPEAMARAAAEAAGGGRPLHHRGGPGDPAHASRDTDPGAAREAALRDGRALDRARYRHRALPAPGPPPSRPLPGPGNVPAGALP